MKYSLYASFVFFVFFLLLNSKSYAQSSRDSESDQTEAINREQFARTKKASSKVYKKGMEDQKLVEYEELMKANKKKYKKMAKGMKKPQYSDPSYFGHKRKPKKRRLSKRKFCEECGIIH